MQKSNSLNNNYLFIKVRKYSPAVGLKTGSSFLKMKNVHANYKHKSNFEKLKF